MIIRTQQNIKELIPEAPAAAINKLAILMKDGRAARRKEIEQQSPDFWGRLTRKIDEVGLTTEYVFLNSLAAKDQVCVGIKRGLMGGLTGTYIWMLFPLINLGTNKLSNIIALEAFNTQDNAEENKKRSTENTDSEAGVEIQPKPSRTKIRHYRSNLLFQSNRKKRIFTNQRRGYNQRNRGFHKKHQPFHD